MARLLLLSDSNFLNNIGEFKGRKIEGLEVKSCQSCRLALSELAVAEEGIVVVACLDMIAADISRSTTTDAGSSVEVYYNQLLLRLVDKVDEAEGKLAIGVVAPLFWTTLSDEVKRSMNHTYKLMKVAPIRNIFFTEYLRDVKAGADGTHLTKRSAGLYIQHIHDLFGKIADATGLGPVVLLPQQPEPEQGQQSVSADMDWTEEVNSMTDDDAVTALGPPTEDEAIFPPTRTTTMLSASILIPPSRIETRLHTEVPRPILGDTQSRLLRLANPFPDMTVPPPTFGSGDQLHRGSESPTLASLARRVGALESTTFHNNVMMAALKEDQDAEANKAMLNRITFSAVVIEGLQAMSEADKVKAMKEKVMEIVNSIKDPEQTFELLFVKHLNNQIRGQRSAVIEAKFANATQAQDIRKKFVEKHKELGLKINVTPVVRVATRVRVEMMHSIANLLLKKDLTVTKAMCVQFIPKPVIKVVRKNVGGTEITRTMSFTEAVCWIRAQGLENALDLGKARARLGALFRGTVAQHFVLMD